MAYTVGGGYPTVAEIRNYVKVPATNLTDPELEHIAGAEQGLQGELDYGTDDAPDPIYQAFMRRVARHIAARGLPIGIIGLDSEFGTQRLPRWDAEIERLEAPYTVPVIA